MAEFEQKFIYPLINLFIRSYAILMSLWYGKTEKQIWKTGKRFYEWTELKTSLYKGWLQIWLQANTVPRHFSLYRSTK